MKYKVQAVTLVASLLLVACGGDNSATDDKFIKYLTTDVDTPEITRVLSDDSYRTRVINGAEDIMCFGLDGGAHPIELMLVAVNNGFSARFSSSWLVSSVFAYCPEHRDQLTGLQS